jgi:hypothetical protein
MVDQRAAHGRVVLHGAIYSFREKYERDEVFRSSDLDLLPVCIIGAGSSGVTAAKALKERRGALIHPIGPTIPLVDVQAQWLASVLSNDTKLPDRSQMQSEVRAHREHISRRYVGICSIHARNRRT